jgi:hypothetical protein
MHRAAVGRAGGQRAGIILFVVDRRLQLSAVAQREDHAAMIDKEMLTLGERHVADAGNLQPDKFRQKPNLRSRILNVFLFPPLALHAQVTILGVVSSGLHSVAG